VNKDGYIIGSEYVSDLVEGEHKTDEEKDLAHGTQSCNFLFYKMWSLEDSQLKV
jgi:hypothetical protein